MKVSYIMLLSFYTVKEQNIIIASKLQERKKMLINYLSRKHFNILEKELRELDEIILELGNKRQLIVDPAKDLPIIMPKVVWKYRTYVEISLHRVVDLAINVCEAWNREFPGISFILIRCIFENVAYLFDIFKRTEKYVNENDFKSCDNLIMNMIFGTRMKNKKMPLIPNILNAVDMTDKIFKGFREHYENLCEFTHPNYMAMYELYCRYDEKSIYSEINSKTGVNEKSFSTIIISLLAILKHFNLCLQLIEKLYPKLTELSDVDYKMKKQKGVL